MMNLRIASELRICFPELNALLLNVNSVRIQKKDGELEKFKLEVTNQVRKDYTLGSVKDDQIFRAYRDFFWRIKIDPTKIRPAGEALVRRILSGKMLPCINTLVDAYNLASVRSRIALATFDTNKLQGNLQLRFSKVGEHFFGIGMVKPLILKGREIVISDEKKLIAVYPYRDADNSKVTTETRNVTIIVCGVPGISEKILDHASSMVMEYINRFCGGKRRE